nr:MULTISPECIES: hypothetical protein [unclassified Wenzhouxiangella]
MIDSQNSALSSDSRRCHHLFNRLTDRIRPRRQQTRIQTVERVLSLERTNPEGFQQAGFADPPGTVQIDDARCPFSGKQIRKLSYFPIAPDQVLNPGPALHAANRSLRRPWCATSGAFRQPGHQRWSLEKFKSTIARLTAYWPHFGRKSG